MAFASFDSDFAKPVEVEVRKNGGKVAGVRVRPASAKVTSRVQDNTISLTFTGPSKVSVEVNGDIHGNLMVFAIGYLHSICKMLEFKRSEQRKMRAAGRQV